MQWREGREQDVHASASSHYVGYFLSVFLKLFDKLFSCDTIHPMNTQGTGGLKRPIKKKFDPRSGILHIVGDP